MFGFAIGTFVIMALLVMGDRIVQRVYDDQRYNR